MYVLAWIVDFSQYWFLRKRNNDMILWNVGKYKTVYCFKKCNDFDLKLTTSHGFDFRKEITINIWSYESCICYENAIFVWKWQILCIVNKKHFQIKLLFLPHLMIYNHIDSYTSTELWFRRVLSLSDQL